MSRPRGPEQRRRQKGSDERLAHFAARHLARRAWWVVLGIFAGCAVGPDYVPPQISVPQAWHAELSGGATAEEMDPQALANWWTTFDDPTLTSLIERAVRNNVDLKKARARVGEARASRGVSRASLFPTLGFTVSATRSHSSQNAMGDT